jgi:hypothetical protein
MSLERAKAENLIEVAKNAIEHMGTSKLDHPAGMISDDVSPVSSTIDVLTPLGDLMTNLDAFVKIVDAVAEVSSVHMRPPLQT